MNRRQRRTGPRAQQLARTIACPDCNSETSVTKVAPRTYRGEVRHDDPCPWYTAFKHRGGYGIRLGHHPPDGRNH